MVRNGGVFLYNKFRNTYRNFTEMFSWFYIKRGSLLLFSFLFLGLFMYKIFQIFQIKTIEHNKIENNQNIEKSVEQFTEIFPKDESINAEQVQSEGINLNTATKEELLTLPGIGEKKADDILAYRQSQSFTSIDELKEIQGIGEKTLEKLAPLITI